MLSLSLSDIDTQLENQYQILVAKYYHAQADFHKSLEECARVKKVVRAKQEVIIELLPYYPYALTQELQDKINLT